MDGGQRACLDRASQDKPARLASHAQGSMDTWDTVPERRAQGSCEALLVLRLSLMTAWPFTHGETEPAVHVCIRVQRAPLHTVCLHHVQIVFRTCVALGRSDRPPIRQEAPQRDTLDEKNIDLTNKQVIKRMRRTRSPQPEKKIAACTSFLLWTNLESQRWVHSSSHRLIARCRTSV